MIEGIEYLKNTEFIPNKDLLFYRIQKKWIEEGDVIPGVFREIGEGANRGMSTDWCKYASPKDCQNRAKEPEDNGVVHFITGDLRDLELNVVHAPFIVCNLHSGNIFINTL